MKIHVSNNLINNILIKYYQMTLFPVWCVLTSSTFHILTLTDDDDYAPTCNYQQRQVVYAHVGYSSQAQSGSVRVGLLIMQLLIGILQLISPRNYVFNMLNFSFCFQNITFKFYNFCTFLAGYLAQ